MYNTIIHAALSPVYDKNCKKTRLFLQKLKNPSAARATVRKRCAPHPSRLRRATFPLVGRLWKRTHVMPSPRGEGAERSEADEG